MHGDAMHTVADLRIGIRQFKLRLQSAIGRPPALAAIVGPEHAGGADGNVHPLRVRRVLHDRMQTHPAGARLPQLALGITQTGKFLPGPSAIRRTKERRILDPGIHRIRISQGRFQVPDSLELPGSLRAVVVLMRRERLAGLRRLIIDKHIARAIRHTVCAHQILRLRAGRIPGLAAVIRPLNDLPEPTAGLRRI